MTDLANVPASRLTLQEQADFILALHDRTFMSDGAPADVMLILTGSDRDELAALGHRLARMALVEPGIRALVTGRSE